MKQILFKSLAKVSNYFFLKKFELYLNKNLHINGKIWILDIDNTFADTWPYLKNRKLQGSQEFYRSIPLIEEVKIYFQREFNKEADVFIFLTARNFIHYNKTIEWLQKHNLIDSSAQVCLVDNPSLKIKFVEYATKKSNNVILLDDLSYNHENGQVLYYDEIIKNLNSLGILHLDYKFITKLRKSS